MAASNARPGVPVDLSRLRGDQARPYLVRRQDVETRLPGVSMIQQVLATNGLTLVSYTGADQGTGIVTVGLAETGVLPGQYNTVVVDAYGRVTHAWVDTNSGGGGGLSTVTDDDTIRAANTFYAGPDGITGIATFRLITPADIPGLDASKINTGVFADTQIASAATWNAKLSSVSDDTTARSANSVYAGPSAGIPGLAAFRALVAADIPSIPASKITSGTLADVYIASAGTWNAKLSSVTADTTVRGANTVYAGPNGASGSAVFRALVAADIPGTLSSNTTGYAARWSNSRTIAMTGDVSWSVSVDGSGNVTAAGTLSTTGVTAGSYGSTTQIPVVTVDAKGRVTGVSLATVTVGSVAWSAVTGRPTTLAGYGITDAWSNSSHPTTLSGYGITDAVSGASGAAGQVMATPATAAGSPSLRALVDSDIPSLDAGKIISGVFNQSLLGTGTANSTTWLRGDGTWVNPDVVSTSAPSGAPSVGQLHYYVVEP